MKKKAAPLKKLRIIQLAAVIFFTVSGGPYGIESLLSYVQQNVALLLLFLTPLLWDVPTILTVLELNSMMPVEGGYYQWVKKALGIRWAFYEGWWTWLYTFVDLAIYPVLFIEYASFLFPQIEAYKIPVCLFIIWSSAIINILGIVPVGKISIILSAIVLTPFFILFGIFFFHHSQNSIIQTALPVHSSFSAIGMGVLTVMWNFFGWDNATTYAGEVNKPVRSYIISTVVAFILIFIVYQISVYVAGNSGISISSLTSSGFPAVGELIGGKWLGTLFSIGGMASALGLFSAVLLSVSRVPQVMAEDNLLPQKINKTHFKYNTPYISIIICASVVSLMILFTFTDLIIMDVTLYGAGLFLEFISVIVLRRREKNTHRPFKIPLGIAGLSIMFMLAVSVYAIGLTGAFFQSERTLISALFAIGGLLTGEVAWQIIFRKKSHLILEKQKLLRK